MDFYRHFNDAQRLADSIDDWGVDSFTWAKAYVACAFACRFQGRLGRQKDAISLGFGESVKLHRGFLDAVLECFDEVVEKVAAINSEPVPVYITGHSLGGAMAVIFHAHLAEHEFHPFIHRRRYRIGPIISCYTFGMPRYGDLAAKSVLPQPFHTFNEFDAIPTLPPTFIGFADSANERCFERHP